MKGNSLYKEILNSDYSYVTIKYKTIRIGKKKYLEKGVWSDYKNELLKSDDLKEYGIEDCFDEPWKVVSILYQKYKYSIPSAKKKTNFIFKALPYDELTDDNLIHGLDRIKTKNMLEGYILIASHLGILKWQDETQWFWQDETDKDLVVLKKYILD